MRHLTLMLLISTSVACGHSPTAPSPIPPTDPKPQVLSVDDFLIATRSDAPTPSHFDGRHLYFWPWIRVENGVGTFTPSANYVMLERRADGWHLVKDKTWGTQRPGLYYEQDSMWAPVQLTLGRRVGTTGGTREVKDLATCTLQFTESPVISEVLLEEHRTQHFNTWGDVDIIVLHEVHYGEYYAYGLGLGLVGFHMEGQPWQWFDWRYAGQFPSPSGC